MQGAEAERWHPDKEHLSHALLLSNGCLLILSSLFGRDSQHGIVDCSDQARHEDPHSRFPERHSTAPVATPQYQYRENQCQAARGTCVRVLQRRVVLKYR